MKKKIILTFASCIFVTQTFATSLMGLLTGDDSIYDVLNEAGFGSPDAILSKAGQCVNPSISNININDICSLANYSLTASTNVCSNATNALGSLNIPGLSFHSGGTQKISASTQSLYDYCKSHDPNAIVDEQVKDVVDKATIWATQNISESVEGSGANATFPNGLTYDEFYEGENAFLDVQKISENKENNPVTPYYLSKGENHQATAKYLIDLTKTESIGNAKDTTGVKLSFATSEDMQKLGVPADMKSFAKKVNQYSQKFNDSFNISSPQNLSATLDDSLEAYTNGDPQSQANTIEVSRKVVAPINEAIDKNAIAKKAVLKELYSSDKDLAVPTSQTLILYDESVRPKYAMLIQKQQMREAYINSLVDNETKTKKDIVELERRKAVIMKSQFDEEAAKREIDALIK